MTPAAYSAFDMPRDGFRIQVRAFTTNDRAALEEAVSRTGPGPSTAVSSSSNASFSKEKDVLHERRLYQSFGIARWLRKEGDPLSSLGDDMSSFSPESRSCFHGGRQVSGTRCRRGTHDASCDDCSIRGHSGADRGSSPGERPDVEGLQEVRIRGNECRT